MNERPSPSVVSAGRVRMLRVFGRVRVLYPKRQRGVAKMRRTSGVKASSGSVS